MKNEIAVSGQLGMKDESGGDHEKPPTDNNQGPNYIVQEQKDLPTMGESQHVALPIVGLAILILIFVLLVVSKCIPAPNLEKSFRNLTVLRVGIDSSL